MAQQHGTTTPPKGTTSAPLRGSSSPQYSGTVFLPSLLLTPFGPGTNMTLSDSSTYQGQDVYVDLYRGEVYDYSQPDGDYYEY